MNETYSDSETVGTTTLYLKTTEDLHLYERFTHPDTVHLMAEDSRKAAEKLLARYRLMECPHLYQWTAEDSARRRLDNEISMAVFIGPDVYYRRR